MRSIAYLGDHVALTTTQLGHKIFVDTDDIVVSPHVLMEGIWEPWIAQFLKHIIAPGMRVIDVGAHIGWYTLLAAELVGEQGSVVAYEPNPRLAALLERSISVNGFKDRAHVMHAAASSTTGMRLPLFIPKNRSGNARLIESDSEDAEVVTVETVRLDEGSDIVGRAVDFIKVDAEGHERRVLLGAEGLLRNPKIALLIEHHPGGEGARLFEWLQDLGFRSAVVEHDSTLRELSDVESLRSVPDSEMLYFQR